MIMRLKGNQKAAVPAIVKDLSKIDLESEYEKIKSKQSKLTRSRRDAIVNLINQKNQKEAVNAESKKTE